ncbi:MAG: AraC family transcriptional regulator [Candidatus Amulumruptor caecigallinarius]|nr:AraC family transcriptional regulator [Candidatus Amulumruptor caecigallinarius]MCM1396447.1 AraC family transcriptional regulator [Candidatus Amulumruptor caecigallinarius]MCM1453496.1 AraC family transcriptional regulator [bacterium]
MDELENTPHLRDDVTCLHLTSADALPSAGKPVRVDGWMMVLGVSGSLPLEVDLAPCRVDAGSVCCLSVDNIVRAVDDGSDYVVEVMMLSRDFLRDLNIDLGVINLPTMARARMTRPATMTLDSADYADLTALLGLIRRHTSTTSRREVYQRSIVRNLVGALLYQLMAAGEQMMEQEGDDAAADTDSPRSRSRRAAYVRQFMALVQKHHRHERSVAFYADRLYISAKYLSLVVKECTGRSAGCWIDDMVILEAKNLLRFSGKNVQQVAYELNFANQSAFGKYFKHLTGLSPTQYLKT